MPTKNFIFKCKTCKKIWRKTYENQKFNERRVEKCCGAWVVGEQIWSNKSEKIVKCSGVCRNAKGGSCDCVCNGEHHGDQYAA